jgi:hypothetical protein
MTRLGLPAVLATITCMACGGTDPTPAPVITSAPTSARDVAPILHAHCSPCRLAEIGGRLTGFRSPELLEALAAALAADGQFQAARETIGKAIELARLAAREDLVERYRLREREFENGEAFILER